MSLKKQFPQIITSCNLLCGCVAAVFALHGNYPLALAFIVGGAVFDFFDGFAARLLGVAGPFGRELDSLADDITFGFAPAAVVASLLGEATFPGLPPAMATYMPWAGFLIAAFSALRLAKFNLDERQTMGFIGLPTPANALFWASLALGLHDDIAHIEDLVAKGATVLDVRGKKEIEKVPLPSTVQIPLPELRGRLAEVPADGPVYVSCMVGLRGHIACRILQQHGIDAINLGYTLDLRKWTRYIQSAKLYLTIRDLAVFTNYNGLNPEVDINGLYPGFEYVNDTASMYPQTTRFTLGVQITF